MANMVYWRSSGSLYRSISLKCTGYRPLAPMMRKFHDDSGEKDDLKKQMSHRLKKKEWTSTGEKDTQTVGATGKIKPQIDSPALSKLSISNEINSLSNVIPTKKNSIDIKNAKSSSKNSKSDDASKDKGCLYDDLDPNAMIVATRVKAFVASAEVKELVCKTKLAQDKKAADTKSKKSSTSKSPATQVILVKSSNSNASSNKKTNSDETKAKATGSSHVGTKPGISKTNTNIKTLGDKLKDKVKKTTANDVNTKTPPSPMNESKKDSSQLAKSKSTSDIKTLADKPKNAVEKSEQATKSGDKSKDEVNTSAATGNENKTLSEVSNTQSKNDTTKDSATPVKSKSTSDTKTLGDKKSDTTINANKKPFEALKYKSTCETTTSGDKSKDEVNSSAATGKENKTVSKVPNTQSKRDLTKDGATPVKSKSTSDIKTVCATSTGKVSILDATNISNKKSTEASKNKHNSEIIASNDKTRDKMKSATTVSENKNPTKGSSTQSKKDSNKESATLLKSKSSSDFKSVSATPTDKVNKLDAANNSNNNSSEASKNKNAFEIIASNDKTKDKMKSATTVSANKNSSKDLKIQSKKDSNKESATPLKSKSSSDLKSASATTTDKVKKLDASNDTNKESSEAPRNKNSSEKLASNDKTKYKIKSSVTTPNKNSSKAPKTQPKNDSKKDGGKPVESQSTSDMNTLGGTPKDKVDKSNTTVNDNKKASKPSASNNKTNDKVKSSAPNITTNEKSSLAAKTESQRDVSQDGAKPVNSKSTSDIEKDGKTVNSNKKSSEASKTKSISQSSGDKSKLKEPDSASEDRTKTSETLKNASDVQSDKPKKVGLQVPWNEMFSELYKSRSKLANASKTKALGDKENLSKPNQSNKDKSHTSEKSVDANPKTAENKISPVSQAKISSETELSKSQSQTNADDDPSINKSTTEVAQSKTLKNQTQCQSTRCQRKSIAKQHQSEAKVSRSQRKTTAESERAAIAAEVIANPKRFSSDNELSKPKTFLKLPDENTTASDSDKAPKNNNSSTASATNNSSEVNSCAELKSDNVNVDNSQCATSSSITKDNDNDNVKSSQSKESSDTKASQNEADSVENDKPKKKFKVKGCLPTAKNQTKPNTYGKTFKVTFNPKNTNPKDVKNSFEATWSEESVGNSGKKDSGTTIKAEAFDIVSSDSIETESFQMSQTQNKTDFSPDGINTDFKNSQSIHSHSHGLKEKCAIPEKKKGSIASLIETQPATHVEREVNLRGSQGKLAVRRQKSSEHGESIADIFQCGVGSGKSKDESSIGQTENSNAAFSNVGSEGSLQRVSSKETDSTVAKIVSDEPCEDSQKSASPNDVVADCHTSPSALKSSRKDRTLKSYDTTELMGSDVNQFGSEFVTKQYQTAADSVHIKIENNEEDNKGSMVKCLKYESTGEEIKINMESHPLSSSAEDHSRKVTDIAGNESIFKGEQQTKQTDVATKNKVSAEPKRKLSLTQYLYEIITGRGNGNNESGRRSITTYSAVSFRSTISDNWLEERGKVSKSSRRRSTRRLPKNDVYISPDVAKRGLGAENIRRDRRSNSQDNRNFGDDKGSHWLFDTLAGEQGSELLVMSSPACIPDLLDANNKMTTTLNEDLILGAGRAQVESNVVRFADDDQLTKIRGGNKMKCEDKSPLAKLKKKKESENSPTIEIEGGSETCAKKFKNLQDSKDNDECAKRSFSTLGRQFCQNLLLFISRADKKF